MKKGQAVAVSEQKIIDCLTDSNWKRVFSPVKKTK